MVAEEQEELLEQQRLEQQSHDNVRNTTTTHTSVKPVSFMATGDIVEEQINLLRRRKLLMHGIMSVGALLLVTTYLYFYVEACSKADYYTRTM